MQTTKLEDTTTQSRFESNQIHESIHFDRLCSQFAIDQHSLKVTTLNHNNRTVIGNKPFSKDETIMEIHKDYFINSSNQLVQISCLLKYIKSQVKEKDKIIMTPKLRQIKQDLQNQNLPEIIFLVQNRSMNCCIEHQDYVIGQFLSYYVSLLPKDYSHHPVTILEKIKSYHKDIYNYLKSKDKRINRLANSISRLISFDKLQIEQPFQDFLRKQGMEHLYIPYLASFTRQNIRWAMMVLSTRSFKNHTLIPLLDMLNHSCKNQNVDYKFDEKTNKMRMYATKQIQEGQQMLISYNRDISVQDCYKWYGFVPNQEEVCKIDMAIGVYMQNSQVQSFNFKFTSQSECKKSIAEQLNQQLASFLCKIQQVSSTISKQSMSARLVQGLLTSCTQDITQLIDELEEDIKKDIQDPVEEQTMRGLLEILEVQRLLNYQIIIECYKFIRKNKARR